MSLTDKRKRRITSRLEEGRTAEELCEALKGAQHDDWLMGRKKDSPGYTGIDTLLRDDDQVLRLIKLHRSPPKRRSGKRPFRAERKPGESKGKSW